MNAPCYRGFTGKHTHFSFQRSQKLNQFNTDVSVQWVTLVACQSLEEGKLILRVFLIFYVELGKNCKYYRPNRAVAKLVAQTREARGMPRLTP